jgi:hypothetical protein
MVVYYTQGYSGFDLCPVFGVTKVQNVVNTTFWSQDWFLSLVGGWRGGASSTGLELLDRNRCNF